MPAKAVMKKAAAPNLQGTFAALRAFLKPYEAKLRAAKDTPDWYYLETRDAVWRGKPAMFAGVRRGKNYVSLYLMSVYADKSVGARISPELMKRKQGKCCFNFTTPDPKLFAELKSLIAAGAKAFVTGRIFEIAKTMKCD